MKKFIVSMLTVLLVGCGGGKPAVPSLSMGSDNMPVMEYPDFPLTPDTNDSWTFVEPGTNYTIDWYVDVASWNAPSGLDQISGIIKQKTGISVKFDTPVTDDGQKLATMIAGGDLPDVLSIPTSSTQTITSLAQQGYVYDINGLAERWAPTLFNHLPEDVWKWWEYGNGTTYG
ncbi:MAG: extracellular solute-binding protein, partial [Bacillales bacterium]|nr:extracellular solute-binding protein [Bacillales bacterium]